MSPIVGFPYLRVGPERILSDPWQLLTEGGAHQLSEFHEHWDYNVNLTLARSLVLDLDAIHGDCGLEDQAVVNAVAVWRSAGTALRGRLCSVTLPAGGGLHTVYLEGEIPGGDLSSEVSIHTQVILAACSSNHSELAATLPGSVLWQDIAQVALEGPAPRFPMEVVDFTNLLVAPSKAAWYLSWNAYDWHQPLLGGVRLFVNSRHKMVLDAVSRTPSSGEARAIRSMIYYEVGRSLVRGALLSDEFIESNQEFVSGTVGCAIFRLLSLLFPGDSPNALRSALLERPEHFDSVLQERLHLLWDE